VTIQSSEQVRAEYLSKLGKDLGEVYYALWNETAWLHSEWRTFLDLYTAPETVALLNETADHFFADVQVALLDGIVLSIARLTGPRSSAGQANLTVRRLANLVPEPLQATVQDSLESHLDKWKQLEAWRHKRIAHRDLHVALGTTALLGPTVETITAAIDGIAAVMNVVAAHLLDTEVAYNASWSGGVGGVSALLHFLRIGKKESDARIERLRAGMPLPGDFD
jgi:hypothetical protein